MAYYDGISDIIKNYIDIGSYENLKYSRTNLNKIIKWTSSKYNEFTKDEVIQDLVARINLYASVIWRYRCGSYAEGNHNRGKSYVLYIKDYDNIFIICIYEPKNIKVYKLEVD